jgi:uncharacterized small protein (DUF1192 family)
MKHEEINAELDRQILALQQELNRLKRARRAKRANARSRLALRIQAISG